MQTNIARHMAKKLLQKINACTASIDCVPSSDACPSSTGISTANMSPVAGDRELSALSGFLESSEVLTVSSHYHDDYLACCKPELSLGREGRSGHVSSFPGTGAIFGLIEGTLPDNKPPAARFRIPDVSSTPQSAVIGTASAVTNSEGVVKIVCPCMEKNSTVSDLDACSICNANGSRHLSLLAGCHGNNDVFASHGCSRAQQNQSTSSVSRCFGASSVPVAGMLSSDRHMPTAPSSSLSSYSRTVSPQTGIQ